MAARPIHRMDTKPPIVNWDTIEFKNALKIVIKCEMQSLMDRLSEAGEETVLLTATTDGQAGHLASNKGEGFVTGYNLQDIKIEFLKYCLGLVKRQNQLKAGSSTSTQQVPLPSDKVNVAGNQKKDPGPVAARKGHLTDQVTIKREPVDEEYEDASSKYPEKIGGSEIGEPPPKRQKQTHLQLDRDKRPLGRELVREAGAERVVTTGDRAIAPGQKVVAVTGNRLASVRDNMVRSERNAVNIKAQIPQSAGHKPQRGTGPQQVSPDQQILYSKHIPGEGESSEPEHDEDYSDEEEEEFSEGYSEGELPEDYPESEHQQTYLLQYRKPTMVGRYGPAHADVEDYFSNSSAEEEYYNSLAAEKDYEGHFQGKQMKAHVGQTQYSNKNMLMSEKAPVSRPLDHKSSDSVKQIPKGQGQTRISPRQIAVPDHGPGSESITLKAFRPQERQQQAIQQRRQPPVQSGAVREPPHKAPHSGHSPAVSSVVYSAGDTRNMPYSKPHHFSDSDDSFHSPRVPSRPSAQPALTEAQIEALLRKHGAMNEEFIHLSESDHDSSEEDYMGEKRRIQERPVHHSPFVKDQGQGQKSNTSSSVHLRYDTKTNEFREIKGSSAFHLPEDSHHEKYKPNSGRNRPKPPKGNSNVQHGTRSQTARQQQSDTDTYSQGYPEEMEDDTTQSQIKQTRGQQADAGKAPDTQPSGSEFQSEFVKHMKGTTDRSSLSTEELEEDETGKTSDDVKLSPVGSHSEKHEHKTAEEQLNEEIQEGEDQERDPIETSETDQASDNLDQSQIVNQRLSAREDDSSDRRSAFGSPSGSAERKLIQSHPSPVAKLSQKQQSPAAQQFRSPTRQQLAPSRMNQQGSEPPKAIHTVDLEQMSQAMDIKEEPYDEEYGEGDRIEFSEQEHKHLEELEQQYKGAPKGQGVRKGTEPVRQGEPFRGYEGQGYVREEQEEDYDEEYEAEGLEEGEEYEGYEDYGHEEEEGEVPLQDQGSSLYQQPGPGPHTGGRGGMRAAQGRQYHPPPPPSGGTGIQGREVGMVKIKQETFDPEYMESASGQYSQPQQFYQHGQQQLDIPENFTEVGEFMVKCLICGKIVRKEAMTKHNLTHIHRAKSFQCDLCGKAFSQESRLIKHRKIHFEEKAFVCPICQKDFKLKTSLQRHMKKVHPGDGIPEEEPQIKQEAPSQPPEQSQHPAS